MNQKSWDRLPEDLKPIVTEVAGNPFHTTGGLDHKTYGNLMDEIKDRGVEIHTLPKEEADRWAAGFQEVTKQWVDELEKQGKPAREAVEMYKKIVDAKGVICPAYPVEWH
jgi:TRAP-type C4-dicarboxylate transport system substrate-binding protein